MLITNQVCALSGSPPSREYILFSLRTGRVIRVFLLVSDNSARYVKPRSMTSQPRCTSTFIENDKSGNAAPA